MCACVRACVRACVVCVCLYLCAEDSLEFPRWEERPDR